MSQTRSGWLLVLAFIAVVLVLASGALIAGRMQRASDLKLCELIKAQRTVYSQTPPTTPTGRELSRAWDNLSRTYGCE